MADRDSIVELSKKICSIMDVSYYDMILSRTSNSYLCRTMCVYFCSKLLSASYSDFKAVFFIDDRCIRYMREDVRDGLRMNIGYYCDAINLIEENIGRV